ncbi:hypothetical protein MVEN_01774100 [Mycena venus]|uniref:Uncharacterized protein n=1 Tax=Mycena venus TaxID=2733690 RepID=A0A8H6XN39_9AGAR|nr:hypothetical protein MVEN_01774100 [Mycena venus]
MCEIDVLIIKGFLTPELPQRKLEFLSGKPMDPVLADITIGGLVEDLVEPGRSIKDSVEKVREDEERLSKLGDNVIGTLSGLAKLASEYEDVHPSAELHCTSEPQKLSFLVVIRLAKLEEWEAEGCAVDVEMFNPTDLITVLNPA